MRLTLVPIGGLYNRLRVVLSALSLARDTHCAVSVEWGNDKECGAWFDELFEPTGGARPHIVRRRWWAAVSSQRNLHLPGLVRLLAGYTYQSCHKSPPTDDVLRPLIRKYRRAYLASGYQLCPYGREELARLQPLPHLRRRIAELTEGFAHYTVGVHIRRTDNTQSIAGSPTEAFRRAMEAEIARNFNVRFFLATDDEDLKRRLTQDYPDRVITQTTDVRRDTLRGMEEAVVDLWCLAATRKLLASYWSSFSDTAAELGNIPVEVVRDDSSHPPA